MSFSREEKVVGNWSWLFTPTKCQLDALNTNCHYTYFCPQYLGADLFKIVITGHSKLVVITNLQKKTAKRAAVRYQHKRYVTHSMASSALICQLISRFFCYVCIQLYLFFFLFQTCQCVGFVPLFNAYGQWKGGGVLIVPVRINCFIFSRNGVRFSTVRVVVVLFPILWRQHTGQ